MTQTTDTTEDGQSHGLWHNALRNKMRKYPQFFEIAENLISAFMGTLADSDSKSFEGEPDRHKVLRPLEMSNIVGSERTDMMQQDSVYRHGPDCSGFCCDTTNNTKCGTFVETTPMHMPVLDIDMPIWVNESTTPGHWHLIIDKSMPWRDYEKLLLCMNEVGILEDGFVSAALSRKASWIRTPWTKKQPATT